MEAKYGGGCQESCSAQVSDGRAKVTGQLTLDDDR
jgi:hypothetical protein